jgi:hypothetical protein
VSNKAATTEDLGSLHKAVADALVEDLASEDPVVRSTARAQAISFLKNNNITAGKGNAELAALEEALAKQKAQRQGVTPRISAAALEEAAELAAARNLQ